MKNSNIVKTIVASLLSISIFSAVLPMKIAQAASVNLFVEDFESYEVGTIVEAESDQSSSTKVGNIEYQLRSGDKLEIAEENGNKYLKITRPSTSATSSHIKYNFPETYADKKYSISFDFKPDVHNRHFARFGSFIRTSGVNLTTISYGNDVYAHGSTNTSYYIGNLLKTANYDGSYAHITQTIDLTKSSSNYEFTAVYPNGSGGTTVKTRTNTANQLGIKGLAWAIQKNSNNNYNGKDDASAVAVYRIDNIIVSEEALDVSGANIEADSVISANSNVELTFDYNVADDVKQHISLLKGGETVSSDDYDVDFAGNKVTVSGFDYNSQYKIIVDKDLKSSDGKPMKDKWELSFTTNSIIEHNITKALFEEGFTPQVTQMSGITYEYSISKDGGAYEDYNLSPLNEIGSYALKIIAKDENEKTQTENIEFGIVGAVPPEAKDINITISGSLDVGTELQGGYTYYDINDDDFDNKDYCVYQWYRSSEENGVYTAIEGATGISYTLTADDENQYIKFGVKPYSKVEPKEGDEAFSSAVMSFMIPVASNIEISGTMATDEVLTASYTYSDLNGDAEITEGEGATIISWYTADSENGVYEKVGEGINYTIKEADINKWFKVGVIPKNNGGGSQVKEYYSQVKLGAFSPVVSGVKLIGNANVGSTISVDYKFDDVNGTDESGSVVEWYVAGALVSSAPYYVINSRDKGKSIYAVVTPHTTKNPIEGTPVQSDIKTVSDSTNTVKLGGGSGGGSSSGGGSVAPTPANDGNQNNNNGGNATNQQGFSDVSGHWAEQAISKMVEQGIIFGKSANEFAPEDKITRAEFAALISRLFNLTGTEYTFNDVSEDSWYGSSVAAVAAAGYMTGANGDFRPEENMTREEMAVVLSAITTAKNIESSGENATFTDFDDISDWAKNAVSIMVDIGIISGMDDNSFMPKGEATRAQTVMMLTRLQSVLSEEN